MTNKKTLRALLIAIVAMLLCASMLVGATFAWFTDSVSSVNNIIKSGNLDIEVEYSSDLKNWKTFEEGVNVFDEEALWEPGYTEVVYFRVKNAGSLALKYWMDVQVVKETASFNQAGEEFWLSNFIKYGVVSLDDANPAVFADREAAHSAVVTTADWINEPYSNGDFYLESGEYHHIALVAYMPTTVGNDANHATGEKEPTINLGITLRATQYTVEFDSFDEKYDENAQYTGLIMNYFDLKGAALRGGEYVLGADIEVVKTVQVSRNLTIDLAGFSLDASKNESRPFEMADGTTLTINGRDEEVKVGRHGLVNIPEGNDAAIVLNGGNYTGATQDGGSFIRPRGTGDVTVVLTNVTYSDTANNGWVMSTNGYTGKMDLYVEGGDYTAAGGFIVPASAESALFKNVTVENTNAGNSYAAIASSAEATVIGCTVTSNHAIVAMNGATVTVQDCTVNAPASGYAFQVMSTGGTVDVTNTTYTGKYGTTGKVNSGCVAMVYIDGVRVFRK